MPKRVVALVSIGALLFAMGVSTPAAAQSVEPLSSGRPMPPEQACFDVLSYRLDVRVDPAARSILGRVIVRARLLEASDAVALDLDQRLTVREVRFGEGDPNSVRADYVHENGEIRIAAKPHFERLGVGPGDVFEMSVDYGGVPRVAPRPPWDGGFVWETTADGSPWIATANQMQGADLWWPCKDQPSDEPAEMDIFVTVPKPLVCASNGRLVSTEETEDGELVYHWHVSTPINVYGVALNIAPYRTISTNYESVAGDVFPITYWVLPENYEKGKVLFEDIVKTTRFLEETFGPYPFRKDKYGVAETPHLGMEHQSIIAYGNDYRGNRWGFDSLHHHEMSHEWWANLVTCRNWKDFWIHEGFGTYAQALYVEKLHGAQAYRETLLDYRGTLNNLSPVAPREAKTTIDVYFAPGGGDIYNKGSWILHTLRWLLGDEDFFVALRRMAYPAPELEARTDGSACRFTDTEEIRAIAEKHSGRDLAWFFEVYLRQPALPRLEVDRSDGRLRLTWHAPNGLPFPMPVEVRIDGELRRVELPGGEAELEVGDSSDVVVDPNSWLLKVEPDGTDPSSEDSDE